MRRPPTAADVAFYQRVDRLVDDVLALPRTQRAAYLDRACTGETRLRAAVERLLGLELAEMGEPGQTPAADRARPGFLEASAFEDLAADLATDPPAVPSHLEGYRILGPLGSGGMGDVFLAQDVRLGRQVALKVLPRAFAGDADRMRRFEREARAVSSLNHPNILTLYDIVDDEGAPCLVLEFVDGETLGSRLERGRLPPLEAVQVAAQIAAALKAAHEAGVVHRDIKPDNVMLRRDGLVKVLDFGLAKLVQRSGAIPPVPSLPLESQISAPGHVLGTPSYMSPEQAAGRPIDARSDLYSLGVVVNEMVADRPPELARIIDRLLRPDPAERYADAAALVRELNALRLHLETSAATRAEGGLDRPGASAASGAKIAAGVLGGALLLLLLAWAWVEREGGPPRASVAGEDPRANAALERRDTILVGDFDNVTNEPVFDATLTQALAVYLEQSPYLSLFPEQGVRETLAYMKRPADQPLSPALLREICQRNNIRALVTGRIAPLGSRYVVTLEATAAATGVTLARSLGEAGSKEAVLQALQAAATRLRLDLGESLGSVRAYDVPLEKATTPSFEALRDYALGRQQMRRGLTGQAIPLFLEAVRRDPSFASAYAHLAAAYRSQGNNVLDRQYATEAYELRARVSERESLLIQQQYESFVLGDLDRAVDTLRQWRLTYPHDHAPASLLGSSLLLLGRYEESIDESRAALAIYPDDVAAHVDLGLALSVVGRRAEALAGLESAEARGIEMQRLRYALDPQAWIDADERGRLRPVERAMGPASEAIALNRAAAAAIDRGQAQAAFALGEQAIAAARRVESGLAGRYGFETALRAASLGRCEEVDSAARATLALTEHPWALSGVALAWALCGRERESREVLDRLVAAHPHDTVIQRAARPATLALFAAGVGRFEEALQFLVTTQPYETGTYAAFWPVYIRGLVLLEAGRHREAGHQFERVIDFDRLRIGHSFSPSAGMARFHLARALVAGGDPTRAREIYDELLSRWQDADPGLAVLAQARAARDGLTGPRVP